MTNKTEMGGMKANAFFAAHFIFEDETSAQA